MKMAKASQADLDAAIGICSALEASDRGFMPEGFDTDDGDRADFDIDDSRDCRNVLNHQDGGQACRQCRQDSPQGLHATGRGADHHQTAVTPLGLDRLAAGFDRAQSGQGLRIGLMAKALFGRISGFDVEGQLGRQGAYRGAAIGLGQDLASARVHGLQRNP